MILASVFFVTIQLRYRRQTTCRQTDRHTILQLQRSAKHDRTYCWYSDTDNRWRGSQKFRPKVTLQFIWFPVVVPYSYKSWRKQFNFPEYFHIVNVAHWNFCRPVITSTRSSAMTERPRIACFIFVYRPALFAQSQNCIYEPPYGGTTGDISALSETL